MPTDETNPNCAHHNPHAEQPGYARYSWGNQRIYPEAETIYGTLRFWIPLASPDARKWLLTDCVREFQRLAAPVDTYLEVLVTVNLGVSSLMSAVRAACAGELWQLAGHPGGPTLLHLNGQLLNDLPVPGEGTWSPGDDAALRRIVTRVLDQSRQILNGAPGIERGCPVKADVDSDDLFPPSMHCL